MRHLILGVVLVLLTACSSQSGNIIDQPRTFLFSGKQYSGEIALVIPKEVRAMKHEYEPGALLGSGGGYEIEFGQTVTDMMVSASQYVYSNVALLLEMPQAGQFERILKITNKAAGITNDYDISSSSTSATVQYSMTLIVESFDGRDLKALNSSSVIGTSSFRSTMSLNQSKGKLVEAITLSISQSAEKLANLLGKGFAEPVKME